MHFHPLICILNSVPLFVFHFSDLY